MEDKFEEESDKIGSSSISYYPVIEDVMPKDKISNGVKLDSDSKHLIVEQPVVLPPDNTHALAQSSLQDSVFEKISFVDKLDLKENKKYKENMIRMMELGFKDFDLCLESLKANDNDAE